MSIPLLVIVGPTASGKTALAVELALRLSGEVLSADSMQLYRGMDLATAKPTQEEMRGVPHHLLDILDADLSFSVVDYLRLARPKIEEIHARGRLPMVVGGTGLYVSSLLDNLQFSEIPENPLLRAQLRCLARSKGNGEVYRILQSRDPESAAALHPNNVGRVIRAIEVYETSGIGIAEQGRRSRSVPSPYDACVIGLRFADRAALYDRINRRVDEMMARGLLEEARKMLASPLSGTASQAIGYKEFQPFFAGSCTLEESVEALKQNTRNYAKRQMTWFGRDARIRWLEPDRLPPEALADAALTIYTHHFGKRGYDEQQ